MSPGDSIQNLFLEHADFNPEVIERTYPNAKRVLAGGLFVSHSGLDYLRVRDEIVFPVVMPHFSNAYFLHNKGTGGAERYRELIQAALDYCTYFLLALSQHSIGNDWVRAELAWAVARGRPIVACLMDETSAAAFASKSAWLFADFREDKQTGQDQLKRVFSSWSSLREQKPG